MVTKMKGDEVFMAEDIRKVMLTQMKVTEENRTFFDSIINPVVREWCFLCMAEKMDLNRVKQVCEAVENEPGKAGLFFMEERERNLRERYENNKELKDQYIDLVHRVEIMYERTHALEEGLTGKLSEAMQEKDRVFGQMIETKDMVIRDRENQLSGMKEEIVDLKKDIKSLKAENHTLLEKNAGLREQTISLEAELKAAEDRISSMELNSVQAGNDKKEDKAAGRENDGTGPAADEIQVIPYNRMMFEPVSRRKRWGFFNKGERLAEEFIRLYMENDDYSDEQRDYLIKCLEQGDTLDVIKEFASPNLSVAHMDWLRRITYKRMR